jgi:hypothetical protein
MLLATLLKTFALVSEGEDSFRRPAKTSNFIGRSLTNEPLGVSAS